MTAPTTKQIAETLAKHRAYGTDDEIECCGCDWHPSDTAWEDDFGDLLEHEAHVAEQLAVLWTQPETSGIEYGLAVARDLLQKVADYWDGRPLTHHGDHIMADLLDVLRAITPVADETDGGE